MSSPPSSPPAPVGEPRARTLLAYGLPALPLAILSLPFYVLVPAFYTQALALPIAAVGQVLLAVRLVDAASDPVVGVLADRWRPAFGRRRLWFALSIPFLMIGAWQVFVPPQGAGLGWLALWGCVLSVAWSAAQVPYAAWGAELSRSYEGRNRVTAYREAFTVVGTLLALATPALLPALGVPGERAVLQTFAVAVAVGLPLAGLLALVAVAEPLDRSTQRLPPLEGVRHLLANAPFRRLITAFFINGLANGLPATLFLFFVQYRLGRPDAVGPLLVLYFVCGVAGVPLWLLLARRLSKHRAWAIGMLTACAAFAFAPLLGEGQVWAFALICVVTGFTLGADVVLPASIQADVIDVDTAATGEERSALYLSLWALATKLALAGAVGLAFPVLGAAGFDPAANRVEASGLMMLGLLYAAVPVVLKLGAVWAMWRFPLDAGVHDRLQATIEARRSGVSAG
ncbi:MFS transporter [Alsobacter sp. R-9]